MANNQANIKAVITAEDRASATLKGVGKKTGEMSNAMKAALVGAGVALLKFGKDSLTAFQESQDLIAQTNAVLKSTKGIAGVTADQVDKLSKSLQKETRYSDESVRGVENLLLTFTKINKNIFPQATETVLNMATALGEDTKSASIQLGKALQDPILGITALRRVGVNFSDAQKEVVKKLVETGQSAKAQQLILKELNTEFGGSARAAGDTFAGQLDKLKNKFNDLQERVGGLMVSALTPLVDLLTKYPALLNGVVIALVALATAFVAVKTAALIGTVMDGAKIAIEGVGTAASATSGYVSALGVAGAVGMAAFATAVVAALAISIKKFQETNKVLDQTSQHIDKTYSYVDKTNSAMLKKFESGKIGAKAYRQYIQNEIRLATEDQQAAEKKVKNLSGISGFKNFLLGHYASGTDSAPGGMAIVGEQGPELVNLPRGSQVKTANETKRVLGGDTYNITIQAGAFMGSQQEARKYAKMIMDAWNDLQSTGKVMA